ncbi:hypothetical protein GDO81_027991 [Engystomops pustulosus]|uniref:Uncharacterized protein n=1 Tax=Engystomops pustulosus TaxID=76066 RepID=A0AAV6ZJP6_ENGPU|nr:hypothetical protein GDO81_027991 [Engystomops pustulosus]
MCSLDFTHARNPIPFLSWLTLRYYISASGFTDAAAAKFPKIQCAGNKMLLIICNERQPLRGKIPSYMSALL